MLLILIFKVFILLYTCLLSRFVLEFIPIWFLLYPLLIHLDISCSLGVRYLSFIWIYILFGQIIWEFRLLNAINNVFWLFHLGDRLVIIRLLLDSLLFNFILWNSLWDHFFEHLTILLNEKTLMHLGKTYKLIVTHCILFVYLILHVYKVCKTEWFVWLCWMVTLEL